MSIICGKYAMVGKIQAPHTWIIMYHHILKSYRMYFHWYDVPNLRNELWSRNPYNTNVSDCFYMECKILKTIL